MKYRKAWIAGVILLVLMAAGVRLRMLSIPLERDEGEYAYMGQLMLEGVPPYQLAFNVKMPGTYAAYAVILKLFGESPTGIHLGFLFVNLATLALIYFLSRRWLDEAGTLVCCVSYELLSISSAVLGLQGHATHLVMLCALGGLLLLLRAREKGGQGLLFLSGLLFGLSFLCKQPGLLFGFFALAVLFHDGRQAGAAQWRASAAKILIFSLGLALPLGLACFLIWRAGTFDRFWFWTVTYAQAHTKVLDASYMEHRLAMAANRGYERWLFLVGFLGWIWLLFQKGRDKFLISAFFLSSIGALLIGRYLARHYFVVMLPAVSILTGLAVSDWTRRLGETRWPWSRVIPTTIFVLICGGLIFTNRRVWFLEPPEVASADLYFYCPFVECQKIGKFICEHSKPEDRIAVIGSEPEIYFYSQRKSVSGYIYMYDLVEPQPYEQAMQQEFMHDVEKAKPEYLVIVNTGSSWMTYTNADPALFNWTKTFPRESYEMVGVAEMFDDHTEYRWGKENMAEKPKTYNAIFTWKRKDL